MEKNQDFENGREIQRLELQINTLYHEIYLGSGKENPRQQEKLREVLKEAWSNYLSLASQYHLGPGILRVEEVYKKALGEKS